MTTNERRRHVRVRPSVELPLRVELFSGATSGPLQVVDLSLGGMALQTAGGLREVSVGDRLGFLVAFGDQPAVEVAGTVRHGGGERAGITGVEFVDVGDEARRLIRAYVSDLFERGLSV